MGSLLKIYEVLKIIKEAQNITAKNEIIRFWAESQHLNFGDYETILNKLRLDEKVIEIVGLAHASDFPFYILILPEFDVYFESVKQKCQRTENKSDIKYSVVEAGWKDSLLPNDDVLWVTWSETDRKIILNGIFQIGKPNINSENDLVFEYFFNNPNRLISVKEIEEKISNPLKKKPYDIVRGLGFKGDLLKLFFLTSQDSIQFNNPISKKRMFELNGPHIKLNSLKDNNLDK